MVAYSFKRQFVAPIQVGLGIIQVRALAPQAYSKRQTIRADRRRHARPGEEIQLYCGMRTRSCFLIGRATCVSVAPIALYFQHRRNQVWTKDTGTIARPRNLDAFAQADGFASWAHLRDFWQEEHPGIDEFGGVLIRWEPNGGNR